MNNHLWKNLRSIRSILVVLLIMVFIPLRTAHGAPANFVKVPNVLNIPKDQALASLKNAGLVGTVTTLPVDDPRYNLMVKMQSHKPGDLITKGTVVTLTVLLYAAPPPNLVKVPNVLNIPKDQALASLKNAGLVGTVTTLPVDDPRYNLMVKMQSHKPGDLITKGTVVTLTVLLYAAPPPNLVKVPNVLEISKDQAEMSLQNVGLRSSVKYLPVDNPKYNNMVKIQSHKPGDMILKGTVVTITVLRFPK